MTDFIIKQLPYDLSSNAGLALIGQYLKRIGLDALVDGRFPLRAKGVANSDIVKSYLGLLCQGKNDFDAIEAFRNDAFFKRALGLDAVPSSPTLRQRMDGHAVAWNTLADDLNMALLSAKHQGAPLDFGALPCGYMPLDWDTFVMNNEGSKKEEVGRTYQGVDGYTPSASYLGTKGYCLELDLRPGTQHSALETDFNLQRVLPMAARLTSMPILFRADSGLCSAKLMGELCVQGQALAREVAFIIKWNPRSAPVEAIAKVRKADGATAWTQLRPGKRECLWQEALGIAIPGGPAQAARRIYRLTERVIDKHGNALLLPEYLLEGWSTTLPARFGPEEVIALYADHATHEQFHSEFKSDMDLERLPSGKFDTNYLVCALASVALNMLRLIGQSALTGADAPIRHGAKRRRIKTVIQEMMCKAARMIHHAGRWVLGLGANDRAFGVFERLYGQLKSAHG